MKSGVEALFTRAAMKQIPGLLTMTFWLGVDCYRVLCSVQSGVQVFWSLQLSLRRAVNPLKDEIGAKLALYE
jgi:hypothetical protein